LPIKNVFVAYKTDSDTSIVILSDINGYFKVENVFGNYIVLMSNYYIDLWISHIPIYLKSDIDLGKIFLIENIDKKYKYCTRKVFFGLFNKKIECEECWLFNLIKEGFNNENQEIMIPYQNKENPKKFGIIKDCLFLDYNELKR